MNPTRLWLNVFLGLCMVTGVMAAKEAPALGATRAEVIAFYGQPSGTAHVGKREVLTFVEGHAILENGILKRFDVPTDMLTAAPPRAPSSPPAPVVPSASTATPSSSGSWWITDIDEARTKALAQNKPILFLVTGDMSRCPWGVQFNNSVHDSAEFIRKEAPEFVLLRLDIREIMVSKHFDTKEQVDHEFANTDNLLALRTTVFSSDLIPAIAIVSPDLKQSTEVNMSGALEAKDDMLNYTLRSIDAAKTGSRKDISSVTAAFAPPASGSSGSSAPMSGRSKLFFAALALVVIGLVARSMKS